MGDGERKGGRRRRLAQLPMTCRLLCWFSLASSTPGVPHVTKRRVTRVTDGAGLRTEEEALIHICNSFMPPPCLQNKSM